MKRVLSLIIISLVLLTAAQAQRVSHDFRGQSLARALSVLNQASQQYRIHCIFNELDSCTVTTRFSDQTVPEAVRIITKGLPVKVKQKGADIFVQYDQKAARRKIELHGFIYDSRTHVQLAGASVRLMTADSIVLSQQVADVHYIQDGRSIHRAEYVIDVPRQPRSYIICVSHVGYQTTYVNYRMNNISKRQDVMELPPIYMKQESHILKEVTVTASKVMFYHRGDTIVYNADAFQLAEGSMLDALIKQLPGAELRSNGQIFLNGRFVENLLLNGKDFFRGNNEVMLENLPSYTVKEIKVYDRQSDRARFLGHTEPGDLSYVMDVQLKREYSIGWLANVQVGGGTGNRYLGRMLAVRFTDHSRLSAYANLNNLNDNRKPGEDDNWTPAQLSQGLHAEKLAGIDYNAEERDERWRVEGYVRLAHTDLDLSTSTERTNFLTAGDTYDHQQSTTRNKTFTLRTWNKLTLTQKQIELELKPELTYRRYDFRSATGSSTTNSLDTVLNSYRQQGRLKGYEFKTGLETSAIIKLGTTSNNIGLECNITNENKDDDRFNRQDIDYGNSRLQNDQYFHNHPDRRTALESQISYGGKLSPDVRLYTWYRFAHETRHRQSALYLLDRADTLLPFGVLPSVTDYEQTMDRANSFDSREQRWQHTVSPGLFWHPKFAGIAGSLYLHFPVTWQSQRLHYQRGTIDTTIVRRTVLFHPDNAYFSWSSDSRNHYGFFAYRINAEAPALTHLVNLHDATDPLNVQEGGCDLKDIYTHLLQLHLTWRKPWQMIFAADYRYIHHALAMGCEYDTRTGVRTFRPYSIDGNWNGDLHCYLSFPLDKQRRFQLSTTTGMTYVHSVDIAGTRPMQRNTVGNLSFNEILTLSYKFGQHRLSLKADGTWHRVSSRQEAFASFTAADVNYGLTALLKLPLQLELSTDITTYTRRGYADATLNTTELVWNGRLSRPFCKGRLLLMLDGYDLLGQLSNVTRTINAQGRTEVHTNTLPRYALLHVVYRWNKQPKKKQ